MVYHVIGTGCGGFRRAVVVDEGGVRKCHLPLMENPSRYLRTCEDDLFDKGKVKVLQGAELCHGGHGSYTPAKGGYMIVS